jgi:hypothetical protein
MFAMAISFIVLVLFLLTLYYLGKFVDRMLYARAEIENAG